MELPNMDLIEANYIMLDPRWRLELRKAFKRARRDFLKYVGYHHVNELMAAGLLEEDIAKIKKGKAPENFNVHVRIPFDYGGTNDFSNLIFMPIPPHDELHNKVINPQIKNFDTRMGVVIKLPWREGMVWERPLNSRENVQSKPTMMVARIKQKAAER